MDEKPLKGKTAVVTGASSGIGRAIARRLGEAGAFVFVSGRNEEALKETAAEVEEVGSEAVVVTGNVRDPQDVRALVDRAVRETGRLDIMVNNAGLSHPGTIIDGDVEKWRDMLETNVLALLVGAQAAVKAMRACKAQGHIVNISSIAGRSETAGVYGGTKAAVNTISRTLRKELEEDSIRVVNIAPGAVVTNFGRNFPAPMVQGFLKMAGVKADFKPGEHMPDEAIAAMHKAARQTFAGADDIARAVLFAVTQPIELNVFEIEVRPQKALQF